LLIEGEGIAAHVLQDFGANLERVRGEIARLLAETPSESDVAEPHKTDRHGRCRHEVRVNMTGSDTQGIKIVLHPVSDLAKAKAVYTALLGAPPQADAPTTSATTSRPAHRARAGGGPQGMTSPVAFWQVPDIEAKLAELTAAGAIVKEAAHDVGGGRLVATVADPMATFSACFRSPEPVAVHRISGRMEPRATARGEQARGARHPRQEPSAGLFHGSSAAYEGGAGRP